MTILWALLAIAVALLALVGLHEWGHYLAARLCGVGVRVFSVGFGRPIWSHVSRRGISYQVGIFPLGGYVKLFDEREEQLTPKEQARSFNTQSIFKRMLIIIAGVAMNLFFAVCAFTLAMLLGYLALKPVVKTVKPNSIASAMQAGETITRVNQQSVTTLTDVYVALLFALGDVDELQIQTDKAVYKLAVKDWRYDALAPNLLAGLGLEAQVTREVSFVRKASLIKSIQLGIKTTWEFTALNFVVLKKLITGTIPIQTLAGPLSLFYGAVLSLQAGFGFFCYFLAFISVALAVINLLPIPGLDGAQLVYLAIEKMTGKSLSLRLQLLLYRLGLIIISLIFIQVLLNDLARFMR